MALFSDSSQFLSRVLTVNSVEPYVVRGFVMGVVKYWLNLIYWLAAKRPCNMFDGFELVVLKDMSITHLLVWVWKKKLNGHDFVSFIMIMIVIIVSLIT